MGPHLGLLEDGGLGEYCSEQMQILANPKRQQILRLLLENGPLTVTEIQEHLAEEQSLVSHHLRTLREADFICVHKEGRYARYQVSELFSTSKKGQMINLGCCSILFDSAMGLK